MTRTINGVTEITHWDGIRYYVAGIDSDSHTPCLIEFANLPRGFKSKYLTTALAMYENPARNDGNELDRRLRP